MPRTVVRLTAAHLTAAKACPEQVKLFRTMFPNGAPLTLAAWRKAQRVGLDCAWSANLLSATALAAYEVACAPALAAYEAAEDAAWAAYEAACTPTLTAYRAADATAMAASRAACVTAWAAYEAADATALAAYEAACAPALLRALRQTLQGRD